MGINSTILPDGASVIAFAYNYAINTCNPILAAMPSTPDEFMYVTAVYNLGADTLLTWAPDQPGQDYFANYQKQYQLQTLIPGVVKDARDESTFSSLQTPNFFKTISLQNLQNLKTPYGRQYLQIAQSLGSISLMVMA